MCLYTLHKFSSTLLLSSAFNSAESNLAFNLTQGALNVIITDSLFPAFASAPSTVYLVVLNSSSIPLSSFQNNPDFQTLSFELPIFLMPSWAMIPIPSTSFQRGKCPLSLRYYVLLHYTSFAKCLIGNLY